jgi:hypothetical protein
VVAVAALVIHIVVVGLLLRQYSGGVSCSILAGLSLVEKNVIEVFSLARCRGLVVILICC